MRTRHCIKLIIGYSAIMVFYSCKDIYDPLIETKTTGLLVVEGFINSGQGPTTIHLSRSSGLDDVALKPELGAQVDVEGEDGSDFPLVENANGEYNDAQLTLNSGVQYRLHIRTTDGKQYTSDYATVKYSPLIDSITWQRENDGLRLYTNGRDPQNNNKLMYFTDPVTTIPTAVAYKYPDKSDDTTIYKCWNTLNSSAIILGSTE